LLELRGDLLGPFDRQLAPVFARDLIERGLVDLLSLLEEHLALVVDELARRRRVDKLALHLAVEGVAEDLDLLVARLLEAHALVVLDVLRALVLLRAFAAEDAGVDDDAAHARRDAERAVADVARLLAEDRAEELLLRRELRLALRRDLADEDVARLHFGADADDAALVEVLEGLLADVRDVARHFLFAELRVAGDALELLDVDRGEDVVFRDALADEDRVLEVVALPRHERDEHVLTEGELAHVGRRAVREDLARLHLLAGSDDRLLVEAGRLVRALELVELVDVRDLGLVAFGSNDDARCVDALDDAIALGDNAHAGVTSELAFHAGTDERRPAANERHGLT